MISFNKLFQVALLEIIIYATTKASLYTPPKIETTVQYSQFQTYSEPLYELQGYSSLDPSFRLVLEKSLELERAKINISGLIDYLQLLFKGKSGYLIHVTNYYSLDIDELVPFPIVLFRPALSRQRVTNKIEGSGTFTSKNIVVAAASTSFSNISVSLNDRNPQCTNSRFYAGCVQLRRTLLSFSSKPWTCEVFVRLLPPFLLNALSRKLPRYPIYFRWLDSEIFLPLVTAAWSNEEDYTRAAPHFGRHESRSHMIPSTQFRLHICVTTVEQVKNKIVNMREILRNYFFSIKKESNSEILLWWEAQFEPTSNQIEHDRLLVISEYVVQAKMDQGEANIIKILRPFDNFVKVTWLDKKFPGKIHWHIVDFEFEVHKIILYFRNCQFNDKLTRSEKISPDHALEAYYHLWWTILGNFSIDFDYGRICTSKGLTYGILDSKISAKLVYALHHYNYTYYYATWISDDFKALRFLTCGIRGKDSLVFRELLSTYQLSVWLCTGIFIFLIIVTIRYSQQRRISIVKVTLALYKCLTEQGDPFPRQDFKSWATVIVAFHFIIVAIVLSSAYKNDNVLKMIQPRTPLLYKTYEHLLADNFEIYTRTVIKMIVSGSAMLGVITDKLTAKTFDGFPIPERSYFSQHAWNFQKEISSDLEINGGNVMSELMLKSMPYAQHKIEDVWNELDALLKVSRMLPETLNLLHNLYNESKNLPSSPILNTIEARDLLLDMQQKVLIENLKQCRKVAVLVPYYKALEYLEILRNTKHKYISITIGEKGYTSSSLVFWFLGSAPRFIYDRLDAMKWSGIWEWRGKLVDSMISERGNVNKFVSQSVSNASMAGNILVIFTVFLAGLGVSFTIFNVEVIKGKLLQTVLISRLWKCAKSCYNLLKLQIQKCYVGGVKALVTIFEIFVKIKIWSIIRVHMSRFFKR